MISYQNCKISLDSLPDDSKSLEIIRKWRNDPSIYSWCRQVGLIAWPNHLRWYESLADRRDVKMYSIINGSDKMVGVCGLTDIDETARRAEFSLYIAPEHQRCGYAKEALKTLFMHAFDDLNLNLIWGETFEGNHALELFQKLGMSVEGVRRDFYYKNGKYIDATLISIKRDEFDL